VSLRFFLLLIAPPLAGVATGYLLGGRLAGFRTALATLLYTIGAPFEHGG
jgi:hypothetical protein